MKEGRGPAQHYRNGQITKLNPHSSLSPSGEKRPEAKPHFSRQLVRSRDRKPAKGRASREARSAAAGTGRERANGGSRHGHAARWARGAAKNGHGKHNARQADKGSSNGSRFHANGNAGTGRSANGASTLRTATPSAAKSLRNGRTAAGKSAAKTVARRATAARKDARKDVRATRGSRKPALAAAAKAGNRARYGFTASSRQRSKKRA